jgi:hypothetical protein
MQRAIESKVTYLLDSRHRFDAKSEHSVLSRMSGWVWEGWRRGCAGQHIG